MKKKTRKLLRAIKHELVDREDRNTALTRIARRAHTKWRRHERAQVVLASVILIISFVAMVWWLVS